MQPLEPELVPESREEERGRSCGPRACRGALRPRRVLYWCPRSLKSCMSQCIRREGMGQTRSGGEWREGGGRARLHVPVSATLHPGVPRVQLLDLRAIEVCMEV